MLIITLYRLHGLDVRWRKGTNHWHTTITLLYGTYCAVVLALTLASIALNSVVDPINTLDKVILNAIILCFGLQDIIVVYMLVQQLYSGNLKACDQ